MSSPIDGNKTPPSDKVSPTRSDDSIGYPATPKEQKIQDCVKEMLIPPRDPKELEAEDQLAVDKQLIEAQQKGLKTVTISNRDYLTSLTIPPGLQLENLSITGCSRLKIVDISNCPDLLSFAMGGSPNAIPPDFSKCPNLRLATLRGFEKSATLNFSQNPKLGSLILTNCSKIQVTGYSGSSVIQEPKKP